VDSTTLPIIIVIALGWRRWLLRPRTLVLTPDGPILHRDENARA
jgi:hypothetical protein